MFRRNWRIKRMSKNDRLDYLNEYGRWLSAGGMEPDALAKDLRKLLPKYMLPNLYEKLEALPYNANGKIDRVALKERYLHAEG